MEVFFYGLFMDQAILTKNGVEPSNPRKAYLDNYALKIGNRASLVAQDGERSHGIIMTVDTKALNQLYNEASVEDYIPEKVDAITESNESVNATCYNLPIEFLSGTNQTYALSLYQLARKLGFPDQYLDHIKSMSIPA